MTTASLIATPALVISDTKYVATGPGETPFYEITARPHGDDAAKPWSFITRDVRLWDLALVFEGAAVLVTITWHHARRLNGRAVKVVIELTRDPELTP